MAQAELRDALWPDSNVGYTSLARVVSEARRALGEAAESASLVRTVPRFGYAFAGTAVVERGREPAATRYLLIGDDGDFLLPPGEVLIGRGPECAVRLPSSDVSRVHARVRVRENEVLIDDRDSKNGTWVNGARITEPTALEEGDEILVGRLPAALPLVGLDGVDAHGDAALASRFQGSRNLRETRASRPGRFFGHVAHEPCRRLPPAGRRVPSARQRPRSRCGSRCRTRPGPPCSAPCCPRGAASPASRAGASSPTSTRSWSAARWVPCSRAGERARKATSTPWSSRTARAGSACARPEILAFTSVGSDTVFVCARSFVRVAQRDPALAEMVLIHEALHTLGLGENPPTSGEITARIEERCGDQKAADASAGRYGWVSAQEPLYP